MLQLPKGALAAADVIKAGPLKGFPNVKPFSCPVLALMIEYERTVEAHNKLDADNVEKQKKSYSKRMAKLERRLLEIADEVSHLQPQSMAGAVFQFMLATTEPDTMMFGATPKIMEEAGDRFQRLTLRAFDMLVAAVDDFPETRGYLMSSYADPAVREGAL